MQSRMWLAITALLFSATFWGLIWYPLRLLQQLGLEGVWQTLISYSAALLLILPFLRAGDRWLRYPVSLAVLGLAAGWCNLAFVLALLDGQVVRVLLLFYLSPVWAVLLGRWLLHERLEPATPVLLGLAMAGTLLMLWDARLGTPWPSGSADWLALSAGMTFALSNVMARRLRSIGLPARTATAWIGAVFVALLAIALTDVPYPEAPPMAWGGAAALGLFGLFFATLALFYGVTHMPVQRSSVIMLFEIVVGALSASWLAGETLDWHEWIGGTLIIIAGAFIATGKKGVKA